jgi:hypothetical protein
MTMNLRALSAVVSVAVLGTAALVSPLVSSAQAAPASIGDELMAWVSRNFDEVYIRPDADLAAYRKVIIDQPQVEFQRGWLKYMNSTRDPSRWLIPADQQQIHDDLVAGMGRVFADVFKARGYEIAAAPGPGVLRLTPSVKELFLNAPVVESSNISKSFSVDTADATLILEARDAVTGTVLARFVDRSTAHQLKRLLNYTTSVSNLFWMDALSRQWATNSVKEFEAGPNRVRASSVSPTGR